MNKSLNTLLCICFCTLAFTQVPGETLLGDHFEAYDIVEVDVNTLAKESAKSDHFTYLNLDLPSLGTISIELTPTDIFSDRYKRRLSSNNDDVKRKYPISTFKGRVLEENDSYARITLSHNFINGYFRMGQRTFIIQNLSRYLDGYDEDKVIVFDQTDYKGMEKGYCGSIAQQEAITESIIAQKAMANCYEVEIALASDWLMYEEFGSANDIEDFMIGVLNDVQGSFDDEFDDEIRFEVVILFIVTDMMDDPWTASTYHIDFIFSFQQWGEGGGFGEGYDIASCWTHRDFDNDFLGTGGIEAVCNHLRYSVCQNFTNNAAGLRTLQAHEFGHNFGADHDGTNDDYIMNPDINTSPEWSENSTNQIIDYYNTLNCLSSCQLTPPSADFTFDQIGDCRPVEVNFFQEATGFVDDYFWEFEGGNPSTSTDPNPIVVYETEGNFDVSLTVFNSGGDDDVSYNNVIQIDGTTAGFEYDNMMGTNVVAFTNVSEADAVFFYWDFGDGENSSEENPTHIFAEDGEYEVELEVDNGDCTDTYAVLISITTPPTANGTTLDTLGCAPLTVQFENTSSTNTESVVWQFEGGNPAESTEFSPTVMYESPGIYDVSLIASNMQGIDTISWSQLIEVQDMPQADFTMEVDGFNVNFINDSSGGYSSIFWDFGDGENSSEESPMHQYEEEGIYTVLLVVENECGSDTLSQELQLNLQTIAIISQDIDSACLSFTVMFDGTSSQFAENYAWIFEGGQPSESNLPQVAVEYSEIGSYDVRLITSNSDFSDTLTLENAVVANDVPAAEIMEVHDALHYTFEALIDGSYNSTYLWDFGDDMTGVGPMVDHIYEEPGVYDVVLVASNECGSRMDSISVNAVMTATEDPGDPIGSAMKIFPNPTLDVLQIQYEGLNDYNVRLINLIGQVIIMEDGSPSMVDLSNISAGVYNLVIYFGDKRISRLITKM